MSTRSRATHAPSSGVDLPQRATGARHFLLPATLLFVLAFAAFWPAIPAGFVWDDDAYVTENPKLHDLSGLRDIWFDIGATKMYVPLVFTTFWLEHQLWGTRPLGYHLVNIVFHAAGAVLLWLLLVRLAVPGAWLAAAIFAVHPIYVESVAWVTELKNTQSTLFGLLFLLAYLRFSETEGRTGAARRPWGFYLLALSAFAAALLSKPVVVALPLVLLLLLWWRRWGGSGRPVANIADITDIAAVLPLLALGTAAGLVAMHVEHIYGGARGAPWQLPFLDRALVAGRALWFYVGKLFWPVDLAPIYPRWQIDSAAAGQYLYPLGAAGVLAALWYFRRPLGRGPFVAAASFALLLAPLIGFFAVSYHLNSYVADHFQHHAAPALIALVAAGAAALPRRFPHFRRLSPWMAAALLAVLALASNRYTPAFENEEARCRTTLERNPGSWLAMNNLGVALNRQGKFAEATGWFEKAIRIRQPYPEAESNLGVALVGLGRPQAAIEHYREALRIWPENPLAHNNLGTALAQVGQIEEARAEYEVALRLRPEYPEARSNLARLLATQKALAEPSASAREFAEAVRLDPGSAAAHNGLGMALARQGRWTEAIRELGEALRIRPDYAEARNNLGTALAASGDTQGAIAQFAASVRLQPGSVDAQLNLATALLSTGRPAEALVPLEVAANLAPRNGHAHLLLGVCLAQMERLPEARRHFDAALRIDPEDQEARANLERVDSLLPPP